MKKTLIALAALTAAATGLTAGLAAPAIAATPQVAAVVRVDYDNGRWDRHDRHDRGDHWDRHDRYDDRADYALDRRIENLRDRIRMGERTRQLSRREADRLSNRLDRIAADKRYAERSGRGLNRQEVASLNDRLDRLSGDVRDDRRDYNRRPGW